MTVEQKIADMQQASVEQTQASQALADEVAGKMGEIDKKLNDTTSSLESDYQEKTSSLTITASLGYKNAVERASGGRNTLVIDDQGNENIMVVIPRFNCEHINARVLALTGVDMKLGVGSHSAFKTNGADRGEILIGKYLASYGANNGCAVLGKTAPITGLNYDASKSLCVEKGENWHLMSIHEWAAVALWSLANDTVPRGNTYFGLAHDAMWETAQRHDGGLPGDVSGASQTVLGSGPVTWSHDHGEFGIQDLVGNVWERIDQFKLEEGQVVCTPDNNPSLDEGDWLRHEAFFDSVSGLMSGDVGSPILNSRIVNRNGISGDDSHLAFSYNLLASSVSEDANYVKNEALRRLLVEFAGESGPAGSIYARNYGERFLLRGGSRGSGVAAGLGSFHATTSRLHADGHLGFRPAYFV